MKKFVSLLVAFALVGVFNLDAAVFTVSQDGRGEFTSIQAAIDNARAGDEVIILDFATYKEQVTIDSSKNRLILRSETPRLRKKPTVQFKDVFNVGPRTYDESQDQSKITFDLNGAIRVIKAQGVTIEGIVFDGGEPAPYGYAGIWNRMSPLFSGNAALTLNVAGDAVIRNCEFKNAFYGIYIKDRNEGGIYANANPADLQPQLVVPLSGFGKSGNHLIENNRIHHNSWGFFIESAWDLGSTIRYNLIYDNNISTELAEKIDAMEGSDNQWGGAMFFKDLLLTPMAIYNNTFYHNFIILCADWQVGGTNLVFNNIFGSPYTLTAEGNKPFPAQALDKALPFRTFNCLYALQESEMKPREQKYEAGVQDPVTNTYVTGEYVYKGYGYVTIMNALPNLNPTPQVIDIEIPLSSGSVFRQATVDWGVVPGTIIEGSASNPAFPKASNNRWFEITFKSEDPESPDFLTPDWDDSLSRALVVDQGWGSANLDADGTIADLGAIPLGGIPETKVLVKPKDPVFINGGTSAKVSFTIAPLAGEINSPKIKYIRWIRNVSYTADIWGNANIKSIPASDIIAVDIPPTPLVVGSNTLTLAIPEMKSSYGFFDIIIEGTDGKGVPVTTNVGFLPYRKIDYVFDVVVMDIAGTKELQSVKAGDPVQLWITPKRLDGTTIDVKVEKVSVKLWSNFKLLDQTGVEFALPSGVTGTSKSQVVFTKVPASGFDNVEVNGMFTKPNDSSFFAIRGTSKDIKIVAGPAEKILFNDPRSNGVATVDPGTPRDVSVQAFDRYDNKVSEPTAIGMVSLAPDIGTIAASPVTTDSTGLATFSAKVTKGDMNDTFPVVATLVANGVTDNAKLVVGRPRDKVWILFDDTLQYNAEAFIKTCAGERVKVTIIASKDGRTVETAQSATLLIELSAGLALFGTADLSDTLRLTETKLVNGKAELWITSTSRNVTNGSIAVFAKDGSLVNGYRDNINFTPCNTNIISAAFFATSGNGSVDRAELMFEKKLQVSEIPDSIILRWPAEDGAFRLVTREQCVLDAADSAHLIVQLIDPFEPNITRYSGSNVKLGTYYWWNPKILGASVRTVDFQVADSVGPLITSATLVERLLPGDDSLYLGFTETVFADVVIGESLVLLKNGSKIPVTVKGVIPQSSQVIIAIIDDLGANRPVAGDSLMIYSAGPITDVSKNRAHPENRPVVIAVRQIPADITNAEYHDINADGTVETVVMRFNKKVDPAQMSLRFVWDRDTAFRTLTLAEMSVLDGDTGKTVAVALPDNLFKNSKTESKTSGAMSVQVTFTAFTSGNVKSATVFDKAAPVLTSATYCLGSSGGKDSVKFTLSEPAIVDVAASEPLLFINEKGAYVIQLSTLSMIDKGYMGVVVNNADAAGNAVIPVFKDSAWINVAAAIKDNQGNLQGSSSNRRVPVALALPEFEPEVVVGPNPFKPDGSTVCHIIVRPKTGVAVIDTIFAEVVIYDKVGNKVIALPLQAGRDNVDLEWNGCNSKGRFVGSGTYLAFLRCTFIVKGTASVKEPQRLLIGVQR